MAGDTVHYTLQQCREMALTTGMTAKAQEESRLAAQYNRQAALAAMFPRVTANASYMWNNADVHLLSNSTEFSLVQLPLILTVQLLSHGVRKANWARSPMPQRERH